MALQDEATISITLKVMGGGPDPDKDDSFTVRFKDSILMYYASRGDVQRVVAQILELEMDHLTGRDK